jgi:hypothetical protein
MSEQMDRLEERRNELIAELAQLGDFRAGSITPFTRRCGKRECHCARKGDPGHGPTLRLTYKVGGKTVTESLPDRAAVERAEAEIAEFRRFQELARELVTVSAEICRLRPEGATQEGRLTIKKNRKRRSNRRSAGK